MCEVTLIQILDAREKRALRQKELLKKHSSPLICFTMNIAGPIKVTPLIERAFWEGMRLLKSTVPEDKILSIESKICATGCEAMLCVSEEASLLKKMCVEIEESSPLGRIFDMDVLNADGYKLERENERGCNICGKKGRGCASRRLHSVEELQRETSSIIHKYFEQKDREKISALATQSLIKEARTTPKPGLVDERNSGSHKDMDIDTFIKSANALNPYFYKCVEIGQSSKRLSPEECFSVLKKEGINAEKLMYEATGGVNTHKGAIYSFGIICAAIGRLWTSENPSAETNRMFSMCQELVIESTKMAFENIDFSTAGGRLYLKHGIRGIRGEVADGFPSVAKISLPIYMKALEKGMNSNDAGVLSLLHLIANLDDSSLYNRGGKDGMEYAKNSARELLNKSPFPTKEEIEALDDDFIEKNLSPGGCADLLAVTYFLSEIKSGVL